MLEELSCTQRPLPRTLWRVFGRDILSLARLLSYVNGKFQTGFRHFRRAYRLRHYPFLRCRSAVAAAYTISATFAMQDADAPLLPVPNPSLPFTTHPLCLTVMWKHSCLSCKNFSGSRSTKLAPSFLDHLKAVGHRRVMLNAAAPCILPPSAEVDSVAKAHLFQ